MYCVNFWSSLDNVIIKCLEKESLNVEGKSDQSSTFSGNIMGQFSLRLFDVYLDDLMVYLKG